MFTLAVFSWSLLQFTLVSTSFGGENQEDDDDEQISEKVLEDGPVRLVRHNTSFLTVHLLVTYSFQSVSQTFALISRLSQSSGRHHEQQGCNCGDSEGGREGGREEKGEERNAA